MLTTAITTAERIAAALERDNEGSALRAFIDYSDELARHALAERFDLAAAEPAPTGSAAWDAALAGLVDFMLGASKPSWIESPDRFLASPETPQLGRYDLAPDLSDVPPEFLRRNILMERRTLQSV
jgi:hypothetical protein